MRLVLAGTVLVTGLLQLSAAEEAAAPKAPAAEQIVALPPYLVESTKVAAPWIYAQGPGVEVLSRCTDETTRLLLYHHFSLRNTLTALLPEEFQVKLEVPTTYVLFDGSSQPRMVQEMIRDLQPPASQGGNWILQGLSNYRFSDKDAVALFFVVDEYNFNRGRLTLTPDYFRYLITSRTPSLPAWFIAGMCELYDATKLESVPPGRSPSTSDVGDPVLTPGTLAIKPLIWMDPATTKLVKATPQDRPSLLPLEELFSQPEPDPANLEAHARWRSQAALFIRWALDGKSTTRASLWAFLRETGGAAETRARFQRCFGMPYVVAEEFLSAYLPQAIERPLYLDTGGIYEPPTAEPHEATVAEISRVKGRLDRMEIAFVRRFGPELTARYVEQARRTLRQSFDKGDRDPRLLAEMGLCECEAGKDDAAQPFLEEAIRGKVIRPRAYFELARIYYTQARAKAENGRLTAIQAGKVLQPVAQGLRQAPAIPEAYELIAEVWLRADGQLTPAQLDVLGQGVRLFPYDSRLIYATALLNTTHGRIEQADGLIRRGLDLPLDAPARARFARLQEAVDGAKAKAAAGAKP